MGPIEQLPIEKKLGEVELFTLLSPLQLRQCELFSFRA